MVIASTTATGKAFAGSKRLLALAIQNAGVSVGGAVTPYLYDYFVQNYGLNGNFLLIGGIYLNCLPAAILLSIPCRNKVRRNNTDKSHAYQETQVFSPRKKSVTVITEGIKKTKENMVKIMHLPFVLRVVGVGFSIASLNGYFALVIDILEWKGLSSYEALLAFPMSYGVGIVARLLPGVIKQFRRLSSFVCPIIFCICGACGQLVILLFPGNKIVLIGCALAGLAISGVVSGAQLVIVQILDKEQIAVGLGLMFSSIGILTMIYGPIYGISSFTLSLSVS